MLDTGRNTLCFSTRGKVIFIVSLFVTITLLLQGLMYLQANIFNGVRGYVHGEGLWAKAQKDATYYLIRYSYTQAEADYQAFNQALQLNDGDTRARIALSQKPERLTEARAGLRQGGNHPDDIPSMIWFFQNFQHISYIEQAIGIWQEADSQILQLRILADELHQLIQRLPDPGLQPNPAALQKLRDQISAQSLKLTQLELDFSSLLGEGARWVKRTILLSGLVILLAFISIAIYVSQQIIRSISKAENKLRMSEARFRSLKESNTLGIVTWHKDGDIEEANDYFLSMLGYSREDLTQGRIKWHTLTPPEWEARDQAAAAELQVLGRCDAYEKAYWHKDGRKIPVLLGVATLSDDTNRGVAYIVDLTQRKQAEEQMRLASTVFSASRDGILITDAQMKVISVNQALCNLTGYTQEELVGEVPPLFQSEYTSAEKYHDILAALYRQGYWEGDLIDRSSKGELLPVRVSISVVINTEGTSSYYVAIVSDISERKAREDELRRLAHHDMLTGLPNRVLFNDRFEQALKRAQRSSTHLALIFIDLDDFKLINDRYGHLTGDKLLQIVAQRLLLTYRGSDTIARLGGDEFVVLLEKISDRNQVMETLSKATDNLAAPCQIDGQAIDISISAGVSMYPEDGHSIEQLISAADQAMYLVKKQR